MTIYHLTFHCPSPRGDFRVQTRIDDWTPPEEREQFLEHVVSATEAKVCPVTGARFTRENMTREELIDDLFI